MSSRHQLAALVALTLAAVSAMAGCAGSTDRAGNSLAGDPVVLRGVNPFNAQEVQAFAGEVHRLSHGTVTIRMTSPWRKGKTDSEAAAVRYVRQGHADLAVASARAWHGLGVDSFDALVAPMTIDSFALQQAVLASPMAAQMLEGVAPLGLTGLALLPGPLRRPVGVDKDLLAAADYRGAEIGISFSPVASRFFAELGARSTDVGFFGDPITGYDGIEQQVASVAGNRYDAVARSITANVALWPRPLVVVASTRALQKLTVSQRQVLREAAARAVGPSTQAQESDESESTGILCRRGAVRFVSAAPGDVATLRAAGERVRDWLATDDTTRGYLSGIDRLREKAAFAASREATPSCDGIAPEIATAARPGPRTQLDGTWTMRTSLQQLQATDPVTAGDDGDAAAPENFGDWVFVVDRGRFAFTQQNGVACTWGYGTWVADGDRLEWRVIDGGGIAPSGAANKPGELFDFGWSLFRDTLTLTPVTGAVSPGNFLAQPWHRVSGSVQPRRFFSRCGLPSVGVPS